MLCARAKVFSAGRVPEQVDIEALRQRLTNESSLEALYGLLAKRGLRYGPKFQAVRSLRRTTVKSSLVTLPKGVDDRASPDRYRSTARFHSLIASVDEGPRGDLIRWAPIEFVSWVDLARRLQRWSRRSAGSDGGTGDMTSWRETHVVTRIFGFTCRLLPKFHDMTPNSAARHTQVVPLAATRPQRRRTMFQRGTDIQLLDDERRSG